MSAIGHKWTFPPPGSSDTPGFRSVHPHGVGNFPTPDAYSYVREAAYERKVSEASDLVSGICQQPIAVYQHPRLFTRI